MLLPQIDRRDMSMTKVMFDVHDYGLMFDCMNHADDHDVCTVVSTLCNVLIAACKFYRKDFKPTEYGKGHVRIDLEFTENSAMTVMAVFTSVMAVMEELSKQNPKYLKIY